MSQPKALSCPMCGASSRTDASRCQHCGSRLAAVACNSCFGMIFQGARFCSHCGGAVTRSVADEGSPQQCPRCDVTLQVVTLGSNSLLECSRCDGVWVDASFMERIRVEHDRQAAILSVVSESSPWTRTLESVRYVPCPGCRALMHRVNFGETSGVVVDVCREHGTWFDRDELRRVVEFIRRGGFDEAREKRLREMEDRARRLRQPVSPSSAPPAIVGGFSGTLAGDGNVALADAVLMAAEGVARWLRSR